MLNFYRIHFNHRKF
jgi:cathepsin L